jgi:hypothetical protein
MKPILGANHRATKIEIPLPVDEQGEYAFDEDGEPIEGKTPVVLYVPRTDCMTKEQFDTFMKKITPPKGKPLNGREQSYVSVLAMLEQFVTEEQLELVSNLSLFEVEQIAAPR